MQPRSCIVLWVLLVALACPPGLGAPGIDALSWMAGLWVGEEGGARIEELWMEPAGGLMLGLHRDVAPDGKRAFFEYLRIETTAEGLVYLASPAGRPATPFRLERVEGTKVVFANPEHDFPQRIIYERTEDRLVARIEGTTPDGLLSKEWSYRLSTR